MYYGHVVVGEEPAVTLRTEGALVWTLTTPGYEFSTAGIVVDAHDCMVKNKGQTVRCGKRNHVSGAKYKYTVNVIESSSGKALPALDPFILHHSE